MPDSERTPDGAGRAAPDGTRRRTATEVAAALLIFLVAGVLLLAPALFGDQVLWAGANFVRYGPFPAELGARAPEGINPLSDSVQCFVPWLRFAADAWRTDGSLPLWKDTAGAGAPLVGNGQSAVFFPTNLLAILLGAPPVAHALIALLKLAAGALGAWLLARHLRLSFAASVLCGLVFGFGGFQVAWNLFPLSNVSLLLPVLVLAVDRVAMRPSAASLALLAGVAGLQHLGGHPETAFHCQVAALALGCARSASLRAAFGWGLVLRRVGWIVAGLVLGLLLGAIQVSPLLEYVAHSELLQRRSEHSTPPLHPWTSSGFALALVVAILALRRLARGGRGSVVSALVLGGATFGGVLAGLAAGLLPTFVQTFVHDWFGSPIGFIGPGSYVSHVGAFAGAAFPLAVLGLMAGQPRGVVRAAGVVAGVGLLVGFRAPVLSDVLSCLPLFDVALNERLQVLALLATAALAACGLDALASVSTRAARWRMLAAALLPPLAAFAALACAVRLEVVASSNVPARAHERLVDARLRPASEVAPLFADEPPLEVREIGKLFHGYVVTPVPATEIRLLYGRDAEAAQTQWKVAPLPERATPSGAPRPSAYVFRAAMPNGGQPRERSEVRLEVVLEDRTLASSARLISPDDDSGTVLPFPARPAPDAALAPIVGLSLGVLGLIVLGPARRGSELRRGALLLAVTASLTPFVRGLVPLVPAELFYPRSTLLDTFAAERPQARIVNLQPGRMGPEIPTYYGIADARGYDALQPARVARLFDLALQQKLAPDLPLLGLMSVRLIARPRATGARSAGSFDVIENTSFLPRARLVGGAEIEPDDERALARLREPAFPRERTVVLAAGEAREPPAADVGTARIAASRPDRVQVEVAASAPAWLVLSDTDFPGWVARVDGRPRAIVRANVAFRAVAVQPGDRVVEFAYEPLSFRDGAALSALAAALLGAGLLRARLRSRRGASPSV